MFIGRIKGSVVATRKVDQMVGHKLAVVEPYGIRDDENSTLTPTGRALVTIDPLGAGQGQFVLVTQGSSARMTDVTAKLPVDAVVIGIIDAITVHDVNIYHESQPAVSVGESS